MENKSAKYFKYAIGEIILVVIGILIALQINNWNENNKLEVKKQDYYQQLLEDLKKDKEFSVKTIELLNKRRKEYESYQKEFYSSNLTLIDVYEKLLNLNINSRPIIFNSNTMESLQNSGEISLIPSDIRNKLIDLKNFQNSIKSNQTKNDLQKNNIMQRTLSLFGNLDLQKRVAKQKDLKSLLVTDENRREIILGWENMHAWKNFSERLSTRSLQDLLMGIDIIQKEINKKIKK
ncbi:DUF6090 family protein [uncultured Algibacter sp.]|uniref:DUF6090 family protein n=1 Tax=uncultured Algibacter sp. TaxID=298659 RepID=UPI00262A517E|nr:DUF6090 family protein [uncultured Algibacter sp.]